MIPRYIVNKYCGRTYCGNGHFDTMEECMAFINDGFCDRGVIVDTLSNSNRKIKVRIEEKP